jgi:hypothetical protein
MHNGGSASNEQQSISNASARQQSATVEILMA